MRKTLLTLFLMLLVTLCLNAQEHMKFMGIPIDGTLNEFDAKLINKEFTVTQSEDELHFYKGQFTGKDINVLVECTGKTKIVCRVMVFFDKETSWSSIKRMFNDYKDLFSEKYGSPSNDFHFFKDPYYEGDGYEMQALRLGNCKYSTFWDTPDGGINIDMAKNGFICIVYEDKANMNIHEKEKQEKDLNDI